MRFAIFTHVIHQEQEGRYFAYSPYVREMNLWFKYVDEVEIIAPEALADVKSGQALLRKRECLSGKPYKHSSIIFTSTPTFHLLNVPAALASLIKIPFIFFRIIGAMRRADHLHLRCPGNMGLLAAIAQVFFPKKPKSVKYAGNWDPKARQPWTYRLQKWILSNGLLSRNIKVLVYGNWPGQSKNIIPFFTSSFYEKDRLVEQKDFNPPYKFVYTGNLVEGKGIAESIQLIKALRHQNLDCRLELYGDGILEKGLKQMVRNEGLEEVVNFKGRVNLEDLKTAYRKSHFALLLSKSEGWPKAIAEAMWFGCVPVATSVSCVPWMLKAPSVPKGETNIVTLAERGILIRDSVLGKSQKGRQFECSEGSRDVSRTGFSEKDLSEIISLIKNPEKLKQMSIAAQEWSQQYTLEKFEKAIQEVLGKQTPHVTTQNGEPRTHNRQLTTHNPQQTTDNPKQQTPNNKPRTDNPQLKTDNSEPTTENNKPQTTNYKQLRVLQLIDTLNPGGAERMAINLSNSLLGKVEASYLCCTREEGMLKEELEEGVGYLFLKKKHSLDLRSFWQLKEFIKNEQIDLVHAHGTSWFWGVLLKLSGLKIKLVWHDHYGESEQLENRDIKFLKPLSKYFDGIISVNNDLKAWARRELKSSKVIQLNNFIIVSDRGNSGEVLKGKSTDFKIICVANLRPQKDHLNLLAAFEKVDLEEISLHLIGGDPGTTYSKDVKEKIATSGKKIFYYGNISEVSCLLYQADLGVLSSSSEGLPLALLEYGQAGLPVICTNVGQCKEVTDGAALLVPPRDPKALSTTIKKYYKDFEGRKYDGLCLQANIKKAYSKEQVLPLFLEFYINLSHK